MRFKLAALVLSLSALSLSLSSTAAHADSLTLTGVGGANSDGVYVYPYDFTVQEGNQTATNVTLSCLNFNREIYFNETWQVDVDSIPTGTGTLDGESYSSFRADAWLNNQYTNSSYTATEVQFAIWSIMDPSQVNASAGLSGFDSTAQGLAQTALGLANTLPSSYFAGMVLFIPDQAGAASWPLDGNGSPQEPQIFIGSVNPIPTPEPSSLFLFGTGLMSVGGALWRKQLQLKAATFGRQ